MAQIFSSVCSRCHEYRTLQKSNDIFGVQSLDRSFVIRWLYDLGQRFIMRLSMDIMSCAASSQATSGRLVLPRTRFKRSTALTSIMGGLIQTGRGAAIVRRWPFWRFGLKIKIGDSHEQRRLSARNQLGEPKIKSGEWLHFKAVINCGRFVGELLSNNGRFGCSLTTGESRFQKVG